jgi:hypothetical protein
MGFKRLNLRAVILIAVAGLMLFATVIIRMASHGPIPEQESQSVTTLDTKTVIPTLESHQSLPVGLTNNSNPMKELTPEDTQSIKEMKEQMDSDRLQQKKIKILKLQLEQTNLQLEQEKALSEISKLEKENTSVVNVSNDQGQDKYPDVKVIYIGGTAEEKEAILSINGNNYSVKEKNRPVKNVQVLSITNTAVTVHFNLPQDLSTTIEYKPE